MRVGQGYWPLLDVPDDPWSEPFPEDDLGYADLLTAPWHAPLPEAAYRPAALALQQHLTALDRGDVDLDPSRFRALAEAARVSLEWRNDSRPVATSAWVADEDMMLRIAADQSPAAGLWAPGAFLGPYVEAMDPRLHRRTLAYAVAHWACTPVTDRSPADAFASSKPVPPVEDRAAIRAIAKAPLGLWRAHAEGSRWRLEDRVGLAAHRVPDAPVDLDHAAGLGTLRDGAAVLLRAARSDEGWVAFGPLVLPEVPPDGLVKARVIVELARVRLRARRASVEDALRNAAHRVSRGVHLWAWSQSQRGNSRDAPRV